MDCSLPGSFVHGIFQTRILKWVAISFSRGSPHQGSNPGLPHCRQTLYCISHLGSPQDIRQGDTIEVTGRVPEWSDKVSLDWTVDWERGFPGRGRASAKALGSTAKGLKDQHCWSKVLSETRKMTPAPKLSYDYVAKMCEVHLGKKSPIKIPWVCCFIFVAPFWCNSVTQAPDDSPMTSYWLGCGPQSLHHGTREESRPALSWWALDRLCMDAVHDTL